MVDKRVVEHVRSVKVEPNDTLWSIAKRELGDGQYWLQIFLLNAVELATSGHAIKPGLIGPNYIFPGQVVKIIDSLKFEPSGFTPSGQ